ncbi:Pyridoxine 5'-phosphate oxidase [Pseudonocardia sp. Ae168_Ps1]|uniref:pyridoxamine 5'-phosphate oxidase family protein n=1 Tax=unclassified Pseudonocardia TaxID=2619320 RepID=UPI0001FFDAB6|nr:MULTISPECIES: pyridoxamine 5'-phosphate oxidase family protein [unclassified Pseudonocardia]OLL71366.1 Pyridoxine 5'-phosphate oxidase [Pseudonocardia sp. Ae168_Ps1]OLL77086.1 Pyridoxine 5'-phosphate oxidase [Pseudonocardia sp. Ae150A_Ps1]OLL88803.1 Pyridoxine 5'-phosphate oxidase [Pseudonocardia sp. Ae263_Ps1]OLL91171.1 Pyridoxine 5'-phosphate oxidase [Pseudonocardia sp. Ae356_Ps1]OLM17683.1 Pyridoxine 5'-phosphate oxidase [Pseudonocardia sp. Ae707_Ps1]
MSADLDPVRRIVAEDSGLCTVAVVRPDGRPHTSLVNAGVLDHPVTGSPVAAYVTYGPVKLQALRTRPATSLHWRSGWRWVAVEGSSEIIGPDDPVDGVDVPRLLRDVFAACGGTHDDWAEYDRVMAEQRRAAVLVEPVRVVGNY